MTELATILQDGSNVDMPALRNWLAALRGKADATAAAFAAAGQLAFATITDRDAYAPEGGIEDGVLAFVYRNNDAVDDAANGFYQYNAAGTPTWESAGWLNEGLASVVQPLVDEAEAAQAAAELAADGLSNAVELWPDPFFTMSSGNEDYRVAGVPLYSADYPVRSWYGEEVAPGVRGAWILRGDGSTTGAFAVPLSGAAFDLSGIADGDEMKVAYSHVAPAGTGVGIGARFLDAAGATIGGAQLGTATATATGKLEAISSLAVIKPAGAAVVLILVFSTSSGPDIPVVDLNAGRAAAVPHLIARGLDRLYEGLGRQANAAGLALSMQRTIVEQSALAVSNAASGVDFIVRGDPTYRGWGEISDTPASLAVHAVRFARFKPVAPWPPVVKLRFIWRTGATVAATRAAGAQVVAIAEALVDPDKGEHGGVIALLRDPETYAPITVTEAMLDAKCGLMMQGLDAKGDAVPMEEIYGFTSGFTNPAKHYVDASVGDGEAGAWGNVDASRGLGFEFLSLTDAGERIETVPAASSSREVAVLTRSGPINADAMVALNAKLLAGTATGLALFGDSQTDRGDRMLGGLRAEFGAKVSNGGYCSAADGIAYVPNDKEPATWFITRAQSGTWTNRGPSSGGVGPDGTSAHSNEVGAWEQFACSDPVDGWLVLYQTVSGGGTFSWAFGDGETFGAATAVSTDASEAIASTGLIENDGVLRLTVTAAGSAGVEICGVAAVDQTAGKITLFKFAVSGARADNFSSLDPTKFAAGIAALKAVTPIDGAHIELGANDQPAQRVPRTQFADAYGTFVSRVQAAIGDVALIGTTPTPETTFADISEYTDEVYRIALERGLPFVDLAPAFGTSAQAMALGLIDAGDKLHRTELGGLRAPKVIARTLYGPLV